MNLCISQVFYIFAGVKGLVFTLICMASNSLKRLRTILVVFCLAFCLPFTVPVSAQDISSPDSDLYANPLKIHNDLYAMYLRAVKLRADEACIAVSDSMIDLARSLGDLKAECIAMSFPLTLAVSNKDMDQVEYWGERLKKTAIDNQYAQYFYYASQLMVTATLGVGQYVRARAIIDDMFSLAERTGSRYGLYACNWEMGAFYQARRNLELSVKYYEEALKLSGEPTVKQSPLDCYKQLSAVYGKAANYEKELEYSDMGLALDLGANMTAEISLLDHKMNALYFLGRRTEFEQAAVRLAEIQEKWGKDAFSKYKAPILIAMHDKDYTRALEMLENYNGGGDTYRLRSRIYQETGDYNRAIREMEDMVSYIQVDLNMAMEDDLTEMAAQIGNLQLKAENDRLGAENERLDEITRRDRQKTLLVILALLVVFAAVSIIRTRKYLNDMRQAQEFKDRFIGSMSHEVRTPLNAVVGFSQVLASSDNMDSNERAEYSKYIMENCVNLTMMLDDILYSFDYQSGMTKNEPRETNLRDLCNLIIGSTDSFRPDGVELRLIPGLPDDFTFKTDPRRVQHILVNLLSNACKNTAEGSIILDYALVGSDLLFCVTDTGIGIPDGKEEEIFGRFVKLDSFKPGQGMGLAVCRETAAMLKGRVWVDTSYKQGARFCFSLPVVQ